MHQFPAEALEGGFHLLKLGLAGLRFAVHVGPDLFRIDSGKAAEGRWGNDAGIVGHEILHVPSGLEFKLFVQPFRIDKGNLLAVLLDKTKGFAEFVQGFPRSISASK